MIDSEKLMSCINDMIDSGHIMEECEFVHPLGVYHIKFKKLKKKIPKTVEVERK